MRARVWCFIIISGICLPFVQRMSPESSPNGQSDNQIYRRRDVVLMAVKTDEELQTILDKFVAEGRERGI